MNRQDSRARAQEAWKLRAVGRTWAEIATELGYGSPSAALMAVQRLDQRTPAATPDAVRRSAAEGLRVMRSVLFERFADAKRRKDDETLVTLGKEIRSNIDADAKLHGAHAPTRSQVDVNVRQTATTIIADARERLLSVIDGEVVADQARELRR